MLCPLCSFDQITPFHRDKRRSYLLCERCQLVFVAREDLPSKDDELREYQLHQNDFNDTGYRGFLSRLATPLNAVLAPGQSGLDFGCGPTPLLGHLLNELGRHNVISYDPLFAADKRCSDATYDFISCSEAIEHFHWPKTEWEQWDQLLKPGGWLGIMTKRVLNRQRFAQWHYKNDITHVSFFSLATFEYLAKTYQYQLHVISDDVVLLQKLAN